MSEPMEKIIRISLDERQLLSLLRGETLKIGDVEIGLQDIGSFRIVNIAKLAFDTVRKKSA